MSTCYSELTVSEKLNFDNILCINKANIYSHIFNIHQVQNCGNIIDIGLQLYLGLIPVCKAEMQ